MEADHQRQQLEIEDKFPVRHQTVIKHGNANPSLSIGNCTFVFMLDFPLLCSITKGQVVVSLLLLFYVKPLAKIGEGFPS